MSQRARNFRERIVSLAPDVTSILFAMGSQKLLVGVSKWCHEVAPVGRLPKVGDCWALNVAEVSKIRPTLLIGSVPFKSDVVAEILKIPAKFLALNPRSLADIESNIRLLGRIARRTAAAESLVHRIHRAFDAVARRAARMHSRPRVYAEAWPNPRISSPPWVAELVEIAGGKMVVPAGQRVDDAAIARARPDVIILAWTAAGTRSKPATAYANPRWQDVPAIRDRRVVVIPDHLINTPGPPLIEGLRHLFNALHPSSSQQLAR